MSKAEIKWRTIQHTLKESGIGKSIGTSVGMAVFCGFAIVSLTMFSAVVDHVREFGTLKAIGATNTDLAKLLLAQAVTCAVVGTAIGEAMAVQMTLVMRNAENPLAIPPWLMAVTVLAMTFICVMASIMALMRVRAIEPAMVFR
jgi:putative ABC transport system permease protein